MGTVPLQMIEFNLILKAAGKPVSGGMFWRLLVGTVIMLMFGYLGETFLLPAWPAFIMGMLGWFFILYEIFAGEAGGTASGCRGRRGFLQEHAHDRHGGLVHLPSRPLFGYLLGSVDETFLNVLYNVAD